MKLILCHVLLLALLLRGGGVVAHDPRDTPQALRDLITFLPGSEGLHLHDQYSGYLPALDDNQLHYWLVQSERSVDCDPLVIWFNGGPGCSSLTGLLEECGPFRVDSDGRTLIENPHRWNKIASMLFIESPAGTGFSYNDRGEYDFNDTLARDNKYAAVREFLVRFPRFLRHNVYVFGQSYGGVYVPMLADVLKDDPVINFKGFAVGNGLVDFKNVIGSLPYYEYTHGLLSDSLWREFLDTCVTDVSLPICDFCRDVDDKYFNISMDNAWGGGTNPYDVNAECSTGTNDTTPAVDSLPFSIRQLYMGYPCVNSTATISYLNQASVREALHIPEYLPGDNEWFMCSSQVKYTWEIKTVDMSPHVGRVLDSGRRAMLYYGDADIICNFLGGRWFTESLNRTLLSDQRDWFYTNEEGVPQVGGTLIQYTDIDFVTVKGASHMVPKEKGAQAFTMFEHFLSNSWPPATDDE